MTNRTKSEFTSHCRIAAKTNFFMLFSAVSRMLATVLEWLTDFSTGAIMESRKAARSKAVASPPWYSAFVSSEELWRSRRVLSVEAVFIVIFYINIIIPGKSGRYACKRPLVHLMYWCTHVLLDCCTWLCLSGGNLFGFALVGVLLPEDKHL